MNREHLRLCTSAEWAALVRDELLPWVLGDSALGDDVLEIGAGPGLVTDLLLQLAPRMTAVEIDDGLAGQLRQRLSGRPVEVVTADATELPLPARVGAKERMTDTDLRTRWSVRGRLALAIRAAGGSVPSQAGHLPQGMFGSMTTRSPCRRSSMLRPTAVMTPQPSWPRAMRRSRPLALRRSTPTPDWNRACNGDA